MVITIRLTKVKIQDGFLLNCVFWLPGVPAYSHCKVDCQVSSILTQEQFDCITWQVKYSMC